MFLKYYGIDPLDYSVDRFMVLLNAIPSVEQAFTPKSGMQLALERSQQEVKEWEEKQKKNQPLW